MIPVVPLMVWKGLQGDLVFALRKGEDGCVCGVCGGRLPPFEWVHCTLNSVSSSVSDSSCQNARLFVCF